MQDTENKEENDNGRERKMISITNISKDPNPTGLCGYEIRINRDLIAKFKHNRPDGLAQCLREAADAVDQQKRLETMEMWKNISSQD